jgi:hypothetical protein
LRLRRHVVGGKVEQAYHRGDLFEKRRQLMNAWAAFCMAQSDAKTIPTTRKEDDVT